MKEDINLDDFLLRIVRYGLFLVFLLPFVVLNNYLYPWVTGKVWGFFILVELLLPFYVLLAFRKKEYRPKKNLFLYAVLAYFAVATLAMIFGDHTHRSMWAKPDRLTGMYFQYHLLTFFLMAGAVWRGQVRKVVMVSVTASVALAIYGALQAYVGVAGGIGNRGAATLGNPSYLAQLLVPNLLLTAWLFWSDRSKNWRTLWIISGIVITLGILATRSRGAIVGLGIASLVAVTLVSLRGSKRMKKWARGILIGLAGLLILFLIGDKWAPTHQWLYDQRISVQYFQEASGSRQLLIENGLKGFAQRPILGWGPENFEGAYYFNYDPVTLRYSEYETRQDRPHNIVLEYLVNLGLLGFLAYAAVFFFGWKLLLKEGIQTHPDRFLFMLATVGLLGVNLFIFDQPTSYITLWMLLALTAASIPEGESSARDLRKWSIPATLLAALLSLALLFGVLWDTVRASKTTARLILSLQHDIYEPAEFDEQVDLLLAYNTPYRERDIRAVSSHLSASRGTYLGGPFAVSLKKMSDYEMSLADDLENDYVHALVSSVSILSQWPRTEEQQAALEKSISRMRALSPNRQEVEWIDAQVRTEKGQYEIAEQMYLRAIELDPSIALAHGEYVRFLLLNNRIDDAFVYMKEHWSMIDQDKLARDNISRTMILFFDNQRFDTLYEIYQASVKHDLRTAEWTITGAVAAAALGNAEEARRIVDEVKEHYPERAQLAEQLLQQTMTLQP